jgi:hypothetical protein
LKFPVHRSRNSVRNAWSSIARTNQELPVSHWVYSGSMFQPNGRYLSDVDGVLIGFVHSRAAVIEHRILWALAATDRSC